MAFKSFPTSVGTKQSLMCLLPGLWFSLEYIICVLGVTLIHKRLPCFSVLGGDRDELEDVIPVNEKER